jgi:hypothetical protein
MPVAVVNEALCEPIAMTSACFCSGDTDSENPSRISSPVSAVQAPEPRWALRSDGPRRQTPTGNAKAAELNEEP